MFMISPGSEYIRSSSMSPTCKIVLKKCDVRNNLSISVVNLNNVGE